MHRVLTQKVSSVQKGHEYVLGVRPSRRQPLFALELLPTENHTRTGAVPVDGGHLGVVPLRDQFRAPRVARDGVKRPAGLVDQDRIDDIRAAARKFEFDLGSLGIPGCLDQCCTRGCWRERCPAITVCVWVPACRYLGGIIGGSGHT